MVRVLYPVAMPCAAQAYDVNDNAIPRAGGTHGHLPVRCVVHIEENDFSQSRQGRGTYVW